MRLRYFVVAFATVSIIVCCSLTAHSSTIIGGVISSSTTLSLGGSPYIVNSPLQIGGPGIATLTVEPGVELRFEPGTGLYIGYDPPGTQSYYGHLEANGTADQPITFTSNSPNASPGDWVGIKYLWLSRTDSLRYCNVLYAGAMDTVYGATSAGVHLQSESGMVDYHKLDHCRVDSTLGSGVYIVGGDSLAIIECEITHSTDWGIADPNRYQPASIQDCQISYNGFGGIQSRGNTGPSAVGLTCSGNDISFNGGHPVELTNQVYISELIGNTYTGNADQTILLTTYYEGIGASTLRNEGLPYVVASHLHIGRPSGTNTLTIEPGVELRFEPGKGLYVGFDAPSYHEYWGHLEANGTADQPITFTSNSPDASPGDWVGIKYLWLSQTDSLRYCNVLYAGAPDTIYDESQAGVYLRSGSGLDYHKLDHCRIDSTLGVGVYVNQYNDSLSIIDCQIMHSSDWGIADLNRNEPARIQNCQITYNGLGGVQLQSNAGPSVYCSGNDISYNGGRPVILANQMYISDLVGNIYIGNADQTILLTTRIEGIGSCTLRNDGLPGAIPKLVEV